jgi:hypothetical protein
MLDNDLFQFPEIATTMNPLAPRTSDADPLSQPVSNQLATSPDPSAAQSPLQVAVSPASAPVDAPETATSQSQTEIASTLPPAVSVPASASSSLISRHLLPIMPSTIPTAAPKPAASEQSTSVPDFLYQLVKMLTDDNREIIEWSNGKIEVHSPPRLANEVLHNYFRHSKFASFQRQLNYFGFRKQAGKGKMAPCSYVNEETTDDLRSILTVKVSCLIS